MRDTFVRDNEIHSNKRGNCLVEVKEDQLQETVVFFFIVPPLNAPDTV